MSITNATNFRKNVYRYLDGAVETNDVVTVTTKNGNAVLMNEEEYRSLLESVYLNIPGVAEQIVSGLNAGESEFVDWDETIKDAHN